MRARRAGRGVVMLTTRLMSTVESRGEACGAVRGKPSRMKEVAGEEECGEGAVGGGYGSTKEVAERGSDMDVEERRKGDARGRDRRPRVESSWWIRRSMRVSGTRLPDFITASALMPGTHVLVEVGVVVGLRALLLHSPSGVLARTFSRSRSPELMADSWGNFSKSRFVCVPLPTPGAPTRMIRAARE